MNEKKLFITHIFNIELWFKTNNVLFLLTLSLVSLLMETKYWDITMIELLIFLLYYPNVFESSFTLILQIRKRTFILYFLTTHLTERSRTSITLGRAYLFVYLMITTKSFDPLLYDLFRCLTFHYFELIYLHLRYLISFNSFKKIPHFLSQFNR